ncbi:hypothetical protein C8Q78DRAFT_1068790 [Trametes maxima]|nr:hypothetical protein C8Q78DRAFT_1068790 [Trametes maxima]
MSEGKASIVRDVECSVSAVNDIITLLQRDTPLDSDIVDANYSVETVALFQILSQDAVNFLQSAKDATILWICQTSERMSENLVESLGLSDTLLESSTSLVLAEEYASSASERIGQLEEEINAGNRNLASACNALRDAERNLEHRRHVRRVMRGAAIATLFFAPIVSAVLVAVDLTAIERAIDLRRGAVSTVERQLERSRSQLDYQHDTLDIEHGRSASLTTHIYELLQEQQLLGILEDGLQEEREALARLSVSINDCLLTVNAALNSSATISAGHSMRNVVTGIRGLAAVLGADAMFAGPVARLNDRALAVLDRRIEALRRHRLML